MRPDTGGRVVLELQKAGGDEVLYGASLFTPAGEWNASATIRVSDGEVTFDAFRPEGEPAWMVTLARAFLRSLWKERKDDPDEAWPNRLNRWRSEPSR